MNLPNFFCVGAQKAGTTSLHYILNQHSEIFLPEVKEIHFFNRDENYKKGLSWYSDFYKNVNNQKAIGEICPDYIYNNNCPERIFNYNPNAKLILILRNPAERAFSHYKMRFGRGDENRSFKEIVNKEVELIANNQKYPLPDHYLARGFYDKQIERYYKLFDKKNILILKFEQDFLKKRKETIETILKFINVNSTEQLALNVKATPQVSWKSQKIFKLLNTKNKINQFAKKIINNKQLRIKLKYFFSSLNQKSNKNNKELLEQKQYLINEVFKESITNLENITNISFNDWFEK